MNVLRKRFFKGTVVVLAAACLILLMGLPYEVQAKPKSFPIGMIADLTGPYAAVVGPTGPGVEDSVKYVNQELGGIDGVPIKAYIRDNKGQTTLGLQQYAELVGMKPKLFFLGFWHAPTFEAIRMKAVQNDIIAFGGPNIPSVYPQANSYGSYCLYPEMIAGGVIAARDMWKESRKPRAAILTWDTSYGRAIVIPEFEAYLKKIGVDLVATELFGIRDADVTTQMVRIRAKKPDWIITCIAGGGYLAIVKAAHDLGMKITLIGNTALEMLVAMKPKLFEGAVIGNPARSFFDKDHPGIKMLLEQMKKNNRSPKERTIFYSMGWQYTLLVRHVVQKAVARVGWNKLDTATLKYEMNRLTDFLPLQGIAKFSFTEKRRTPPWTMSNIVRGGKLVYLGDPKGAFIPTPDLRPAKYK